MLTARTMTELKMKIRQAMGWPDRRSWTADERAESQARFRIEADHRRGVFTAAEKHKLD
ncbi:hypothetical protein [Rhodovulum viride]|uniref:hypothetical protein n=1 Tax=Rhodovulum viride TaxID=1231134 RepID=UPI0015EC3456|nr:hypothetical protein [Rhodovulum viride]